MKSRIKANSKTPRIYRGGKMISLILPDELIAGLDRRAKQSDVSRSWVIRQVISGWLQDREAAE